MATKMTSNYRDYESEAHELIKRILHSSVKKMIEELSNNTQSSAQTMEWPTGASFSIEKGLEAIDQLIKTWMIGDSWKYCIDFLTQRDQLYCYSVKWSEPTRRKPVPKATASIYFYLLVYSDDAPILVYYIVEGQRLVYRPEKTVFHEVWLRNVVQNKLAITEAASLALNG